MDRVILLLMRGHCHSGIMLALGRENCPESEWTICVKVHSKDPFMPLLWKSMQKDGFENWKELVDRGSNTIESELSDEGKGMWLLFDKADDTNKYHRFYGGMVAARHLLAKLVKS